tara:strand:+ start:316 stop:1107 length:792 start_codon:yes stop_codon:yes gene_type:complete
MLKKNFEKSLLNNQVKSEKWNVQFDAGRNARGKIGFVLIPNEQTIEKDMLSWAPKDVGMYFSRAIMPHEISTSALAKCKDTLAETAKRILPDDKLDVICFACTSGAVAVGEDISMKELIKAHPDSKATTLITGVRKALNTLGIKKLSIGTPYADELNTEMAKYFIQNDFEILNFQGMNLDYDRDMIKVSPDYLIEFAKAVDHPESDGFLMSCGALRAMDVIDQIEDAIGKPVVTSNQAMLWECLRLAGIEDKISKLGKLFIKY